MLPGAAHKQQSGFFMRPISFVYVWTVKACHRSKTYAESRRNLQMAADTVGFAVDEIILDDAGIYFRIALAFAIQGLEYANR